MTGRATPSQADGEIKYLWTPRRQGTLLFCILMFAYGYIHQNFGWNQNSRLDLLHSMFVHGTLRIDAYHTNTGDKSVHDGHYYSDKAPGVVFLAIPAFAVSASVLDLLDVPLDSRKGWLFSSWITTAGSVGLITAIGGVALFAFLRRLVAERYALLTTLGIFLGAAPFPYATMLFSHAAVAGLLCIALWAIADPFFWSRMIRSATGSIVNTLSPTGGEGHHPSPAGAGEGGRRPGEGHGAKNSVSGEESHLGSPSPTRPWLKRYLLAGLCCGLAISSEYTAATAAGGVLALALLTNFRRGVALALAAVPPLLLIPLYNSLCFGEPLAFGYHHLALTQFQEMNKGLFGITFPPKASAAYLILLSPERGLFFWTPLFLMAFAGVKPLLAASRALFLTVWVVVVLHIVAISGYYMPSGGAALGPRHLAPMIPFAAIGVALGVSRWPRVGFSLGYLSIILTGLATLIEAMPPDGATNPLVNVHLARVCNGMFVYSVGSLLGLPHFLSISLISGILIVPYWAFCFSTRMGGAALARTDSGSAEAGSGAGQ